MQVRGVPIGERLRRIATIRLARPLPELPDPAWAAGVAGRLGAIADPPVTEPGTLAPLAGALSGAVDTLPTAVAGRLASALRLPAGALDPDTDFAAVEHALLREYLGDRGVVDVRSCRGRRGRPALLGLVGLVDRCATGPASRAVAGS